LSSEKGRVKVDKATLKKAKSYSEDNKNVMSANKKTEKEDPYKKRKGVGYTTGIGTQWNVAEYLKSKESKSQ